MSLWFRVASSVCLAASMLLIAGCVELIGQRIVLLHDVERDTLHVLLFYDGVHDSGSDRHGVGREQIPQFARSGSIMLLDWIGHVDMDAVRKSVDDDTLEPEAREMIQFVLKKLTVQPLGHYRDAGGQIGAMQHVQIEEASRFLRHVNTAISSMVMNNLAHGDPEDPMARTNALALAAAKRGHQWVTLDGQAIRVDFPVHPFEWRHLKADMVREVAQADDKQLLRIMQEIVAFSSTYDDTGGRVRILIGDPDENTTFRFRLRDEYEPSLEPIVIEHAPLELPGLWRIGRPKQATAMYLYQRFAPPEQQVIDTLNRIDEAEDRTADEALRLIDRYVEEVSDHVYPAPDARKDTDETIEAWRDWARRMMAYPIAD